MPVEHLQTKSDGRLGKKHGRRWCMPALKQTLKTSWECQAMAQCPGASSAPHLESIFPPSSLSCNSQEDLPSRAGLRWAGLLLAELTV